MMYYLPVTPWLEEPMQLWLLESVSGCGWRQQQQQPSRRASTLLSSRVSRATNQVTCTHGTDVNELSRSFQFHNHEEGLYLGIVLGESAYYHYHIKESIKTLC